MRNMSQHRKLHPTQPNTEINTQITHISETDRPLSPPTRGEPLSSADGGTACPQHQPSSCCFTVAQAAMARSHEHTACFFGVKCHI